MSERMSAEMWANRKALVLTLELFREKDLMSKIMFDVALATGGVPLWALGVVTILETQVKVDVGCCMGDKEGPGVGAREGLREGA